jgi:hypothetical protein
MPTKEDLKRFSVSQNIWMQVVRPLFDSGNVVNPDELLVILKKLTSSLWTRSGFADGFDGAVAGNFQELLDGYRHAVIYKQKVQFGSIGGLGGDTVRTVTEGKHTFSETTQFKVTSSGIDAIKDHIAKASWQLTGAGGEKAVGRSVVEIVVQDGTLQDDERGKTLDELTSDDWSEVIKEALADGYTQNYIHKSKEELYSAVDRVVIKTQGFRFIFMPFLGNVLYMGGGVPSASEGSLFSNAKFHQHWRWLANHAQLEMRRNGYNCRTIQTYGLGPSVHDVPQALPKQG